MKVLIDTQIILWSLFDDTLLKPKEREILLNPENEILCNAISFFEISLKFSIGKLDLKGTTPDELPAAVESMGFTIEPTPVESFASYHQLPQGIHKDPFDRLLIWHCIQNGHTLLSRDAKIQEYKTHGLKTP